MVDKKWEFLKTLSKKNNFLVLDLLHNKGKLHFANIKRILKIDGRTLTDALNELMDYGLVEKEVENPNIRTSRVFYSLTEFGKEAIKVYDYVECLEKKLDKSQNIVVNGNITGNNNIIIGGNVHIKK